MSASHRFIFSTFLFLALGCFWASSAFAQTIYSYYQDLTGLNTCSTSYSSFCDNAFKNVVKKSGYRYIQEGCDYFHYSNINVRYSETAPSYNQNGLYYNDASKQINYVTSASKESITCETGDTFKLDGCTASCVSDPCKAKQGQRETLGVQCGTVTCSNGGVTVKTGSSFVCSKGLGTFVPRTPSTNAVKDQCAMTALAVSDETPQESSGKAYQSDIGSSSINMYCSQEYEYTGSPGATDTESKTGDLNFSPSYAVPDEQGNCPSTHPTRGQLNGVTICATDSGSPPDTGDDNGDGDGDGSGNCPAGSHANPYDSTQCICDVQGGCGSGDGEGESSCPNNAPKNPDGTCPVSGGGGGGTDDGTYTGSNKCDSAPACSGDVVLCGLMAEQHKAKCQMLEQLGTVPDDVQSAADELGDGVSNNSDINGWMSTTQGYMNTLKNLAVPSNSSCAISNIELQILSKTVHIPLSQFCPFFELIRLLLNITVDLVVIRIISRAILSANV